MAETILELAKALRLTASRLKEGARYEWGHMGRCNAGHLLQTVTGMTDHEIVKSIDYQLEEWSEHAREYCSRTGTRVDHLFDTFRAIGFEAADIIHLENLTDKRVLRRIDSDARHLRRNNVDDVCLYMKTLADVLEDDAA